MIRDFHMLDPEEQETLAHRISRWEMMPRYWRDDRGASEVIFLDVIVGIAEPVRHQVWRAWVFMPGPETVEFTAKSRKAAGVAMLHRIAAAFPKESPNNH